MRSRSAVFSSREAERLFRIIISNAATRLDKAKAFNTMIKLYTTIRPPREAVELGLTALKIFGLDLKFDMGLPDGSD